jgi:hypothetical protein
MTMEAEETLLSPFFMNRDTVFLRRRHGEIVSTDGGILIVCCEVGPLRDCGKASRRDAAFA